jgi:hypothetical protein
MDINRTRLGVLLVVCAVAGVGYRMIVGVRRGYYARRSWWRDAPREFFAATGDAVMTGLGVGLSAGTIIFLLAALIPRIGI